MRLLFWLVFVTTTSFSYNTLTYINEIVDGEVIVDGLIDTKCVAVSPDDRSVYVAGKSDNSLVVFTWDTITRKLAYNTRFKDGVNGIDGLYGVECISVSPDNKNVYAVGTSALVIFNRNTSTGALSYATTIKRGTNDLNQPRFITVSPDNKSVYVADVTSIIVFDRDVSTGILTYRMCLKRGQDPIEGLYFPSSISVSPDNRNVYVVNSSPSPTEPDTAALLIFNRDITTGSLSFRTCIKGEENGINGLKFASAVIVSPDNKNVYVAGYGDNSLAVFNRDTETGALTFSACLVDGIAGVDGLYQPTSITVSHDTRNVYVSSSGKKAIAVFNRDVNTGALDYNTCIKNGQEGIDGLFSPGWISMSHDNYRVYVIGENKIGLFNRDPVTGALSYRYCIKNREQAVDGLTGVSDMAMSHDNRNVYTVSSRESILSVFNRDTITGTLTYSTCFKDGQDKIDWLAQPSAIAVSSDNKNVYVVSSYDSAVSIFNRDTVTGALTYKTCIRENLDGVKGLSGTTAYSFIISPDDRSLYISGWDSTLIILNRDVNSGILTYNTTLIEGQNGIAGLELAFASVMSPDGKMLYIVDYKNNIVSQFNRDPVSGVLSFYRCIKEGQDGVKGIKSPSSITMSNDGKNVYVGGIDSTIAIFDRNQSTGILTYRTCINIETGNEQKSLVLTISPDGQNLYAAVKSKTVIIFGRDSVTGDLTRIEDLSEQRIHAGAECIVISPDNKNVYLSNSSGNAILTYSVSPASMRSQRDHVEFGQASGFSVVKAGVSYFITFHTRATGRTELSLFDLQGKLLQKIFNQYSTPGRYSVKENFSAIRNGNYLLRLVNGKQYTVKRITITN